jgi:hypothetical protein
LRVPLRGKMKGARRRKRRLAMADTYWFCLKHHTVEQAEGCKSADRLGPYDNETDASRALERVAERNESWDDDPRWKD